MIVDYSVCSIYKGQKLISDRCGIKNDNYISQILHSKHSLLVQVCRFHSLHKYIHSSEFTVWTAEINKVIWCVCVLQILFFVVYQHGHVFEILTCCFDTRIFFLVETEIIQKITFPSSLYSKMCTLPMDHPT